MKPSRKLDILVTFTCHRNPADETFRGNAVYRQTGSVPDMGPVVDSDGAIHLERAARFDREAYGDDVEICLTLDTPARLQPGNAITPVAWATKFGAGVTVHGMGEDGKPDDSRVLAEFSVRPVPGDPNKIIIHDKDDDDRHYSYKPAVELLEHDHYYISLDPPIVNRPPA